MKYRFGMGQDCDKKYCKWGKWDKMFFLGGGTRLKRRGTTDHSVGLYRNYYALCGNCSIYIDTYVCFNYTMTGLSWRMRFDVM